MKNLLLALMLLAIAPVAITTTGCRTPSSQTVAYKSLYSVGIGVDTAMNVYKRAFDAGKIDDATQLKVRELHGRYQPLFEQAVAASRFDLNTATPPEIAELAGLITETIINAVKKD